MSVREATMYLGAEAHGGQCSGEPAGVVRTWPSRHYFLVVGKQRVCSSYGPRCGLRMAVVLLDCLGCRMVVDEHVGWK